MNKLLQTKWNFSASISDLAPRVFAGSISMRSTRRLTDKASPQLTTLLQWAALHIKSRLNFWRQIIDERTETSGAEEKFLTFVAVPRPRKRQLLIIFRLFHTLSPDGHQSDSWTSALFARIALYNHVAMFHLLLLSLSTFALSFLPKLIVL